MTLATPGAESRLSTGKFSPDSTHDFALLKGWIDRVFITGWAFALDDERVLPKLGHLTAHLLPVSGFSEASFARHGYEESFSTQIEQASSTTAACPEARRRSSASRRTRMRRRPASRPPSRRLLPRSHHPARADPGALRSPHD
ncbi:NAD(P)H-dependent oxidoreductase [Pseudoclavibacter helvolus]